MKCIVTVEIELEAITGGFNEACELALSVVHHGSAKVVKVRLADQDTRKEPQ